MIVAPEPTQRIRENGPAVAIAVEAVPVLEPVVVPGVRQGLRQRLIGERPVAVRVVEIVFAVLQEDAYGLARCCLANERLVVVPAFSCGLAAGDIGKAADPGQDLAEFVRTFPRDRECADPAAAGA